ncbi:BZ3500_MvSof-1268-A1-R1_Chr11-1g03232 [Microbotryum saponariae]|uniref:BZ3500_MvSof-1268-A1-R1_Chr11-1g03232 protein n=1 Tax=Microbotryum saponariae TaxID=289078 RepID=A0A2X0L829_9BASI|nr:BZ3501_MvSof-1269-A2-R1_Chr11g02807 [Microbotryum saponariae]SDA03792.1 BZ3500_MvSof-1268-A1-R1_Chr11-1g03232 [Microbotryum saponariae]
MPLPSAPPPPSSSPPAPARRHASCPPRVLTIAGSDSGAGAGIQADLKTIAALGCYGTCSITALTAQNTLGVQAVEGVRTAIVVQQLKSVVEDIGVDAIKTGMLYSSETIKAIAEYLGATFSSSSASTSTPTMDHPTVPLVLDPVCVATSGHQLLPFDALDSLKKHLIPLATIITPNIPEAELLSSSEPGSIRSVDDMRNCAIRLGQLGVRWVYLKGGHMPLTNGNSGTEKFVVDLLWDSVERKEVLAQRRWYDSKNTHGTGFPEAVKVAADYVATAIATSYPLGSGSGPVHHFHALGQRSLPLPTPLSPTPLVDFLTSYSPSTWSRYVNHPFPRSLADGTCPLPSFLEFITQDYHFLIHYARTNALMGYKGLDVEDMRGSSKIVETVLRETEMHVQYCEQYNISRSTLLSIPESLANLAYNRYVLDTCSRGDLLDARIVTFPCLLGYGQVGQNLKAWEGRVSDGEKNRYWSWIETYSGDWYQEAVRTGTELLESSLAGSPVSSTRLVELAETFKTATILEIAFWDAAVDAAGEEKKWTELATTTTQT